jgi:hypothetical protein
VLANMEVGPEGAGIGEVIGGRDSFGSTPRQRYLDDAMELV